MSLSHQTHNLLETVRRALPDRSSRILAAVSGGADSVALLRALEMSDVETIAINCNFHLRGEESDRDSSFVRALCEKLDIPLIAVDFDVEAYKKERNISTEMACRDLRYDAFRRIKKEQNCDRIAVAHHLDDNVETILLNLFRGTGIEGLTGMKPDNGEIIRPFLSLRRCQILNFLEEIGQDYVTDSTNLQSDFKRNFIRNELLPLIAGRWPGIMKTLSRTGDNLAADAAALDYLLDKHLAQYRDFIPYGDLTAFPDPQTFIFRFIRTRGGSGTQAREISDAIRRHAYPLRWHLPDATILLDRDGLTMARLNVKTAETHPFVQREISLDPETWRAIRSDRSHRILYTTLPLSELTFRHPLPSDRIAPLGIKGTSLVSDILKDAHIPLADRKRIWIAADSAGSIVWIEGLRRSGSHLIAPSASTAFAICRPESQSPQIS